MNMQPLRPSASSPVRLRFSRCDGSYQLNREVFAEAYRDQVVQALPQACVGGEVSGRSVASAALVGQSLDVTYALARQLLGPTQALALGGAAMASLIGPQEADDLDQGMRQRLGAHRVGQVAEAGLYLGDERFTGHGASTNASVILPEGFAGLLSHPVGSFLVGHELGHVQANDLILGFGRKQVLGSLQGTDMEQEVRQIACQLDHQAEFSADRRGLEYALSQGHQRQDILAGFERFLKVATDGQASDSHPAASRRLARLSE